MTRFGSLWLLRGKMKPKESVRSQMMVCRVRLNAILKSFRRGLRGVRFLFSIYYVLGTVLCASHIIIPLKIQLFLPLRILKSLSSDGETKVK